MMLWVRSMILPAPFWFNADQVAPPSSLAHRPASLTPAMIRRPPGTAASRHTPL